MGRKRNKEKDDVNATEVAMEKAVQRVQVILREHSEQEIRETLLQCNLNHNVAIDRLLSQQDESNKQGASTQLSDSSTTTSSVLVPNQSDLANVPVSSGEAVPSSSSSAITNSDTRSVPISSSDAVPSSVPSSSDVTNGETRSVPVSSNEAVLSLPVPSTSDVTNGETRTMPISSSEAVPPLSVPSSSDITNGETRSVTISSNVGAPSLSVPSSRDPTKVTDSDAVRKDQLQESALLIPNPQNSAFPVNKPMETRQQSTATASPLGLRSPTPISMADLNSFFSSAEFQLRTDSSSYTWADHGNMMDPHCLWPPAQNNVPSSEALQQRGGTSNDTSIYESLNSVFAPYRNSTLHQSATSSVPSSHGFDMTSGNDANSRLGYEDVSRIHLPSNSSGTSSIGPSSHASGSMPWSGSIPRVHLPSNSSGPSQVNGSNSRLGYGDYLPPVHLKGRSPFVWPVQREDSYRSTPRYSLQERETYFERIRADLASSSQDQEYNTSDPSDQTQQRPRDK